MSDNKNTVIPNIFTSESTMNGPVDVIWSTADFTHEACLPVIGSCQVSSILSTLEHVQAKNIPEEKLVQIENVDSFKSIPINIINSDSAPLVDEVKKRIKNKNETVTLQKKQLFHEMMYFGCNLCPFICTKDSKISDHIKSVHKNKNSHKKPQLKCPGCTNIFYHKLSLRSHLIYDHEVGRSDINKIVNSIVYDSMLSENNNISNNDEEIDTKTDTSTFLTDEDNLETEQQNLIVNEDYLPKEEIITDVPAIVAPNDIKQQLTIKKSSLSCTKSEEPKLQNQKCCISTCAVRLSGFENMAYHVKCHYEKIFRCLECNANFVVWKTLQTHLWRSHNIDMELYSCDKCNYKTYSLAKLNNTHKLIHGNEKSFLCDLCGKGYKNPKQLRNHKIIHKVKNVDKMQQCNICNRSFADKRMLKVHVAGVHQKIKPFSCNYCSYKAASNGALKLHIRLHTGEKPFACDSCDYSTADHNSLRRHKSRHSNEKKYKCAHCDYACIQSSTYKTHLKTKHPGLENNLMFSCPFCQFRSVSNDKYMIHIASHKDTNKKSQNAQKIIDMIEDICDDDEKMPEVEFVNLKSREFDSVEQKLPDSSKNDPSLELRLQETPVALISKINDTSTNNHCIILPVQNENILNLTNVSSDNSVLPTTNAILTNNIQYFYSGPNILLEFIDEKAK